MNSPAWTHGKRHIFILAGTDIHPFNRICDWADAWALDHPDDDVLVQHGYTKPPRAARGVEILTPEALNAALAGADAAVTHGGPGTIAAVRASGLQPIVLARNPDHGEHVDSHQMRFAAWAGERGLATVAADEISLTAMVEHALTLDRSTSGPKAEVDSTVANLVTLVRQQQLGAHRRRAFPRLSRRQR